jgi:hypothetical protein
MEQPFKLAYIEFIQLCIPFGVPQQLLRKVFLWDCTYIQH